jgi:RNA polymerase sigma factor (sigma-70 family)
VNDAIDAMATPLTRGESRADAEAFEPVAVRRSGEAAELGNALAQHVPVLLATARALVRNEADARDLVQTTLEIAARKAQDLRDPLALRSWLLAIQARESVRLRRRLSHLIHLTPEEMEIPTSPGPDADAIALRTALGQLPPRARASVVLHYLAGLPVADVARAMGISENTTKGHLKAGLARLREELRDD